MTGRHAAPRPAGPWPLASWLMVLATGVGIAAGILSEAVSPVLVLDLVSFWPAGLLAIAGLAVAMPLRRSHPRLLAMPALVLLSWLLLGSAAHLAGWDLLPSGQATVSGSPASTPAGRVTAAMERGRLVVRSARVATYVVSPLRAGGPVGAPQVAERVAAGELQVVVDERPADIWYRFAGWEAELAPSLSWALDLAAPILELDLRGLSVGRATFTGSGVVRLGAGVGRIDLAGDLRVELPVGAAATLEGQAQVPPDWVAVTGGSRSPAAGEGWVIVVTPGATVTVAHP